jgi:hypothetical protein
MKPGDLVRNKNAHRTMNCSRGVFLGMRTFDGGVYTCAMVLWFGDGKPASIQTNLLEVISNVE